MGEPTDRPKLPRRGVLRTLALAPVAVAGCAAAQAGRDGAPVPAIDGEGPPARPDRAAPDGAVAAVRGVRLPADAEPAAIFRAAAARPGEVR